MQINTTVILESGDAFAYTADAAAAQVLAALGGNPTNDMSSVSIQTNQVGQAGTPPAPADSPSG